MVLLVLQLTASGGLYPMPTAPGFFQMLNPLLPMTYLVDGLRVAVSGGEASHAARDAVVLAGVMAAFLALTVLVLRRRRMDDGHAAPGDRGVSGAWAVLTVGEGASTRRHRADGDQADVARCINTSGA